MRVLVVAAYLLAPGASAADLAPSVGVSALAWVARPGPATVGPLAGRTVILHFRPLGCDECSDLSMWLDSKVREASIGAIVVIDIWPESADSEAVKATLRLRGIQHATALDLGGKLRAAYRVQRSPTVVLISPNGGEAARFSEMGSIRKSIQTHLPDLLAQGATPAATVLGAKPLPTGLSDVHLQLPEGYALAAGSKIQVTARVEGGGIELAGPSKRFVASAAGLRLPIKVAPGAKGKVAVDVRMHTCPQREDGTQGCLPVTTRLVQPIHAGEAAREIWLVLPIEAPGKKQ